MQHARNSLLAALRDRLVARSSERAIFIAENQPHTAAPLPDETFVLSFGEARTVATFDTARPLMRLACTISYRTRGALDCASDRGRALAALDAELLEITRPPFAVKRDYLVDPPCSLGTRILWSTPRLGEVSEAVDAVTRSASFELFYYPEAPVA